MFVAHPTLHCAGVALGERWMTRPRNMANTLPRWSGMKATLHLPPAPRGRGACGARLVSAWRAKGRPREHVVDKSLAMGQHAICYRENRGHPCQHQSAERRFRAQARPATVVYPRYLKNV